MDAVDRLLMTQAIALVKADGKLVKAEIDLIYRLAKKLDISEDELQMMSQENAPVVLMEVNLGSKIKWIYRLVLLAMADRELEDGELKVIYSVADGMSISRIKIDQLLNHVREFGTTDLSDEAINDLMG